MSIWKKCIMETLDATEMLGEPNKRSQTSHSSMSVGNWTEVFEKRCCPRRVVHHGKLQAHGASFPLSKLESSNSGRGN